MKKLSFYGITALTILPIWIHIDTNKSRNNSEISVSGEGLFYKYKMTPSESKLSLSYSGISSVTNGITINIMDNSIISIMLVIFILHTFRTSILSNDPRLAPLRLITLSIIFILLSLYFLNLNLEEYIRCLVDFSPNKFSHYYFVGPLVGLILGSFDLFRCKYLI